MKRAFVRRSAIALTKAFMLRVFPFATRPELPATLKDLAALMPACAGVRRFGSASLDLAYVAAGRFDGFWERNLRVWDMAAGIVIAKEGWRNC